MNWTSSSRSRCRTSSRTLGVTGSDFALKWPPVCAIDRHRSSEPSVVSHWVRFNGGAKRVLDGRVERKAAVFGRETTKRRPAGIEFGAVIVLPDPSEVAERGGATTSLFPEQGHLRVDGVPDERCSEDTRVPVYARFLVSSWLTSHAITSPARSGEPRRGRIAPFTDAHQRA